MSFPRCSLTVASPEHSLESEGCRLLGPHSQGLEYKFSPQLSRIVRVSPEGPVFSGWPLLRLPARFAPGSHQWPRALDYYPHGGWKTATTGLTLYL